MRKQERATEKLYLKVITKIKLHDQEKTIIFKWRVDDQDNCSIKTWSKRKENGDKIRQPGGRRLWRNRGQWWLERLRQMYTRVTVWQIYQSAGNTEWAGGGWGVTARWNTCTAPAWLKAGLLNNTRDSEAKDIRLEMASNLICKYH